MRRAVTREGERLKCAICGTEDYDLLVVHRLGLAVGMRGEDYSFCVRCWHSRSLGKKLLRLLGFHNAMLLDETCLRITEVEP